MIKNCRPTDIDGNVSLQKQLPIHLFLVGSIAQQEPVIVMQKQLVSPPRCPIYVTALLPGHMVRHHMPG